MEPTIQDPQFSPDNVYGNALTLLEEHRTVPVDPDLGEPIHLDIGCGQAPLARPLTDSLGIAYVGVDMSQLSVDSVIARGFEAHQVELGDRATTLKRLREIVGERRVASISVLDVLQLMPPGQTALAGVRDLAREHDAVVVVSVPNVTHVDVGFKLAFGRWDITEAGILGLPNIQHFDHGVLGRELRRSGLYPTAERNVELERSDQHFPSDHSALMQGTSLHALLLSLRDQASLHSLVNQFVWLCTPGPLAEEPPYTAQREQDRPFLSVIMRTQGTRLHCLAEALTCLAGQSNTDFEVLVMGHRLTTEAQLRVERTIEDTPSWLRSQVRLVKVQRGRRAAPLNEGFREARGHYIAILDDDDIPLGHWVETFAGLAAQAPGRVLRTISAQQDIVECEVQGRAAIRSVGSIEDIYPRVFDFVDHLRSNYTPNTAIAFPRGVFHDMGVRFDESLTTTEDWDFIMRTVSVVGVASSPVITCIYHWWVKGASSRTDHDAGEWERNMQAILRKFDENPILLPAGSAPRVREALDELDRLRLNVAHEAARAAELTSRVGDQQARGAEFDARERDFGDRLVALARIQSLLDSRSWRFAAPARVFGRLSGRGRPVLVSDYFYFPLGALRQVVVDLENSRSWRLTKPLRRK